MKDTSFVVVGINAHFDNGVSLNVAIGDTVQAVEQSIADRKAEFASLTVSHKLFGAGFTVGAAGTLPAEIVDGKAKSSGQGNFRRVIPKGRPTMVRLGASAVDDWDITAVEA